MLGEQAGYQRRISDVALDENMTRISLKPGQILQVARVGQRIEIDDWLVALGQPVEHKIGADKAGPACYKYPHDESHSLVVCTAFQTPGTYNGEAGYLSFKRSVSDGSPKSGQRGETYCTIESGQIIHHVSPIPCGAIGLFSLIRNGGNQALLQGKRRCPAQVPKRGTVHIQRPREPGHARTFAQQNPEPF